MRLGRFTVTRRDLRLGSGIVLFAYIAVHLAIHALSLWSIPVAEAALARMVRVWHSVPGSVLFYGAALVHVSLALKSIYDRRTLRMPPADLLRILLGLGIPLLLIGHAVGTRYATEAYGLSPVYARVVHALWSSDAEGRQLALLVPGWLHGCLGLWFAFRHHAAVERLRLPLFAFALVIPLLAGLGFVDMGREFQRLAEDPEWVAMYAEVPPPEVRVALARTRDTLVAAWIGLIALVFAARAARDAWEKRTGKLVAVDYPGRRIEIPRGWTVLEASRAHAIPHASVCGGRARCSTCRVRVTGGLERCPPPEEDEARTLARVGAAEDVRLACRLRPDGAVRVVPMVAPPAAADVVARPEERRVALLAATIAGVEGARLPHDALYATHRTAEAIGEAVLDAGGEVIEFTGEGVLALFDAGGDLDVASGRALDAASAIGARLAALERRLADECGVAPRASLGLHAGNVVSGEIGFRGAQSRAVVGPTVDTVRRLAEAARGAQRPIAYSAAVGAAGGDVRAVGGARTNVPDVDDPARFADAIAGRASA